MNGLASHGEHLARHLQRIKRTLDPAKVEGVLRAAGLREGEVGLKGADGSEVGPAQCASYLDAIRRLLGDAEYYPARVDFILARCSSVAAGAPDAGRSP